MMMGDNLLTCFLSLTLECFTNYSWKVEKSDEYLTTVPLFRRVMYFEEPLKDFKALYTQVLKYLPPKTKQPMINSHFMLLYRIHLTSLSYTVQIVLHPHPQSLYWLPSNDGSSVYLPTNVCRV